MESRDWARGLTQDQFAIQFQQRNPGTDVIPFGEEWIRGLEDPIYHGISGVNPEDFTEDGPMKEKPLPAKVAQPGKFPCRGCGKTFNHNIARAGHERKCKSVIKSVEVANAGE